MEGGVYRRYVHREGRYGVHRVALDGCIDSVVAGQRNKQVDSACLVE